MIEDVTWSRFHFQMTKKLAGNAAGMAERITNVSNEHRQVLMSVLTASEGDGLLPMAAGLVRRYREAGRAAPRVLYVNQDCCATAGRGKVKKQQQENVHRPLIIPRLNLKQMSSSAIFFRWQPCSASGSSCW